jgi:hypothetical protein
VLIRMSNETEEKTLPRTSGCRNVTCIGDGGEECREEEKGKRIESAQGHISHVIVGGTFSHKIG